MASDCLDDLLNGEDGDEFEGEDLDYEDEEALLQEEENDQRNEMINQQDEENDVIDLQAEEDLSLTLNSEKLENSFQERKPSIKDRLSTPRNGRKFVLRRNNEALLENQNHQLQNNNINNNNFKKPSNFNNGKSNFNNNNKRMGLNRAQQNKIQNRRNFSNRMPNGRNYNGTANKPQQPQQLQKRSNTVLINPRFKGIVTVTDARVVWDQQGPQNVPQRPVNPWNQTENQLPQNMHPMIQNQQQPMPIVQQQYPVQNQFQQMGPPQQPGPPPQQQHMQQPLSNMEWKNQSQYYSSPPNNSFYEEHPYPQKPNVHDRLGHRQQFPPPMEQSTPMQMSVMNPNNYHNPPIQQGFVAHPQPPQQNFNNNNYQQPGPHFMSPPQQPNPPMFIHEQNRQQFNNNQNMMPPQHHPQQPQLPPQQFNNGFQYQQPQQQPPQLPPQQPQFNRVFSQQQQQPPQPQQRVQMQNFGPETNQQTIIRRNFPPPSPQPQRVVMVPFQQQDNQQNNQMWQRNAPQQFRRVQQSNFQQQPNTSFNQSNKFQIQNRVSKRNGNEGAVVNVQRKIRRVEKSVYQNTEMQHNVQNVQKIVPVKIDPNEDEETRQYRLKIEEQKRKREEILKQKEQRRLEMAKLAKNESGDDTVSDSRDNNPKATVFVKSNTTPIIKKPNLLVNNPSFKNRNNVVIPPSQNNVNFSNNISIKCIPNASMAVDPTNDVDDQHLSSFLSKRTVLAKDQQLMDSRLVVIKNLSDSTPNRKILTMCKEIGDVQKLQRKKSDREAIILFKSVASAHAFYKKYQRYMLDLSMIEVSLKPMQGAICNS